MLRALLPIALLLTFLSVVAHAEDARVVTVRGTVEGPSGPVAGARVVAITAPEAEALGGCLSPIAIQQDPFSPHLRAEEAFCPCLSAARKLLARPCGETLAETTTDSGGWFELPPLPSPTAWRVFVDAGELNALVFPFETKGFVVRVAPSRRFQVRLVDSHWKPVEGATIVPVPVLPGLPPMRTAADGEVTLEFVAAHRHHFLVTADGYEPLLLAYNYLPDERIGTATTELPLVLLPRRATIEGRITFDGKPAPGAKVSVEPACGGATTVADRQGRFSLEALTLPHTLTATRGDLLASANARLPLRPLELDLSKGGFVEGTVIDSKGKPVPQALVDLGQPGAVVPSKPGVRVRTDARGSYRIGPLLAGRYAVRLEELPVPGSAPIAQPDVQLGETARADFTLTPTVRLEGIVVDDSGAPLAQARIRTRPKQLSWPSQRCDTTTGPDGRFSCGEWTQGALEVRVEHPEAAPVPVSVELATGRPLRIPVARGVAVSGSLVDAGGAPVPGAQVVVVRDDGSEYFSLRTSVSNRGRLPPFRTSRTDSSGRFVILLPPGKYLLAALWDDESLEPPVVRRLEAVGRAVEVSLEQEHGEPITGRLELEMPRNEVGTASVDEAHILAFAPGSSEPAAMTVTRPDGRFRLRLPRPGSYALIVRKPGLMQRGSQTASTGPGELVFKVVPGATVTGKVLRPDGTPAARFTVNGEPRETPDGAFSLAAEHLSVIAVRIEAPGCATFDYRLAVKRALSIELPVFLLTARRFALPVQSEPPAFQRDLDALADFGELPPCKWHRPNPKFPGEWQPLRVSGPIEPLAALRGKTPRVLPFLDSPWEPVQRRAVDILCSIQDDEAKRAILELSRRHPCRKWIREAVETSAAGPNPQCPRTQDNAGSELRFASAEEIARWMSEESRARARRISEDPERLLTEAFRDQASADPARRTSALAALAAVDSREALRQLVRELANGFESASYSDWRDDESTIIGHGVFLSALRSTAAAQDTSPARLVFELSEGLSSVESAWLVGVADDTLLAELWAQAKSSTSDAPGTRALRSRLLTPHR